MAFGSILEGPDSTQLKPLVEQAMPMLIETMKDSSVVVKVIMQIYWTLLNFHLVSDVDLHWSNPDPQILSNADPDPGQ